MFLQKFLNTITRYELLKPKEKIVVAVSGGPDSVALTHILVSLGKNYNLRLHPAHLNHLLRGEEAEADASFVRSLSQQLGLDLTIEEIDVAQVAKKDGLSIQQAARKVRYDFLTRVAEKIGAKRIALGHHLDDQVETILMRLIRGCGPEGLAGIPPRRKMADDLILVRPLIEITSAEIKEYLKENKLPYRIDSSNLKRDYLRNKIRLDVLPMLLNLNPNFKQTLLRISSLWERDDKYLEEAAEEHLGRLKKEKEGSLDLSEFNPLPSAIKSRIIRRLLNTIINNHVEFSFQHVEDVLLMAEFGPAQGRLELPGGVIVKKEYNVLRGELRKKKGEEKKSFHYSFFPGDRVELQEIGKALETNILSNPPFRISKDRSMVYLDLEQIKPPLLVRNFCPGDRFTPLGMKGTKKVKDFFIDLKILQEQRDQTPIILDRKGIIWVAPYQISDRVKVTTKTKDVLLASLEVTT
ncbi:MAG: tRNA lysidine(34) synthetase TilS [bacterium]|nr:tRNA lysidine(34) synthetase TilS [bacterium]